MVKRPQPKQRANQLWRWMYHEDGGWVSDLEQTAQRQNGFSQNFRQGFAQLECFRVCTHLQCVEALHQRSAICTPLWPDLQGHDAAYSEHGWRLDPGVCAHRA